MKTTLRRLALAVALAAGLGTAQAAPAVIDFDTGLDTTFAPFAPFVAHNDFLLQGEYFVATASTKAGALGNTSNAQAGDLVGALINDVAGQCMGIDCPTNNPSQFLLMANDGLPWMGRLDGDVFQIKGFDASFVGAAGVTVPSVAMILRVYGFDVDGNYFYEDVLLGGPVNGQYAFDTFTFSDAFANRWYTEVDFYGYACNAQGACNRTNNLAQFALDNIVLNSNLPVPEPASLALAALALVGAGAARRRSPARRAA